MGPQHYGTGKTFRGPTPGLKDVIFGYEAQPRSNPETFKKNSERLALHIGTTFKKQASEAANMLRTLKKGKEGRPKKPKRAVLGDEGYVDEDTAKEDFKVAELLWPEKVKKWGQRQEDREENVGRIYNLVLSHCTPEMETKLKGMSKWDSVSKAQDGIALAQLIRDVLHKKDESQVNIMHVCTAYRALHTCYQTREQTVSQYLQAFQAKADVCRSLGFQPGLCKASIIIAAANEGIEAPANLAPHKVEEFEGKGAQRYLTALFFSGLCLHRYEQLKRDVANRWIVAEKDTTPRTYDAVIRLADRFRPSGRGAAVEQEAGVAFAQAGRRQRKDKQAARDKTADERIADAWAGEDTDARWRQQWTGGRTQAGRDAGNKLAGQFIKQNKDNANKQAGSGDDGKQASSSNKSKAVCWHCGKQGHVARH